MGPQCSEHIPNESATVRFIGVTTFELEVMPYAAVYVTMEWDTLFPISLRILSAAVAIMFCYLKHRGPNVGVVCFAEECNSTREEVSATCADIVFDPFQYGVVGEVPNDVEGEKVATTFVI